MSKAPFLPASVSTNFFENNSPYPSCSFANVPSPTTYKMRFHCLVTEVKLICHLLGEAVSGGALQGWLGVQEDATWMLPLALGRAGCLLLSKMDHFILVF